MLRFEAGGGAAATRASLKQATFALLTGAPDELARVETLHLSGSPADTHHQAQHQQSGWGGHSHSYSGYNSNGGGELGAAADAALDFTEVLLSAAGSCSVRTLRIDNKPALLDTEAAAVSRMAGLTALHLATNSTAQPLRRPLVSLMLGRLHGLQELSLSYIRDTTGDLAKLLCGLPALAKLRLEYAYFGDSGAGEQVRGWVGCGMRRPPVGLGVERGVLCHSPSLWVGPGHHWRGRPASSPEWPCLHPCLPHPPPAPAVLASRGAGRGHHRVRGPGHPGPNAVPPVMIAPRCPGREGSLPPRSFPAGAAQCSCPRPRGSWRQLGAARVGPRLSAARLGPSPV